MTHEVVDTLTVVNALKRHMHAVTGPGVVSEILPAILVSCSFAVVFFYFSVKDFTVGVVSVAVTVTCIAIFIINQNHQARHYAKAYRDDAHVAESCGVILKSIGDGTIRYLSVEQIELVSEGCGREGLFVAVNKETSRMGMPWGFGR